MILIRRHIQPVITLCNVGMVGAAVICGDIAAPVRQLVVSHRICETCLPGLNTEVLDGAAIAGIACMGMCGMGIGHAYGQGLWLAPARKAFHQASNVSVAGMLACD